LFNKDEKQRQKYRTVETVPKSKRRGKNIL